MTSEHTTDLGRRALMGGGLSLAALAATGCCQLPRQSLVGVCPVQAAPFLAGPEVRAAWAKPQRFFDAHAHFFNAADVPVAGYLSKSVAHSVRNATVRQLLVTLAPVVEAVAKTLALTPADEMRGLCDATQARSMLSIQSIDSQTRSLDEAIDAERAKAADALHRAILEREPGVAALVDQSFAAASLESSRSAVVRGRARFSRDFILESFQRGSAVADPADGRIRPLGASVLSAEELQLASMQNAFQFIGFMLAQRHHNLRTYIQRFAQGSPTLPLSGCFGALVDFNYWLDCPGKASNMRDQVLLHEQMSLLSGGFMLPLVGYNPWVDIEENGAGLATVEWAVRDHGCVGVKIYPPMGFYPYGNAAQGPIDSREPRPDLTALDKALARLYELCESLDVPVMAHANESRGRDFVHDKLAGPKGWELVDRQAPRLKSLYVNAGHFGGAEAHADGSDWAGDFVTLMAGAQKLKVYADIGFWDALTTSQEARTRLRQALDRPIGHGGTAAERIMYGSDWLMLSLVPGWEGYGDSIAAVLRDAAPAPGAADRVLGGNVLECFGLSAASPRQNFRRLQQRGVPGWMAPAGASPAP